MKRLNTINSFDGAEYHELNDKSLFLRISAPYVIDDSKFSPITQALKNINGTVLSDEQISQSYDFQNGKDNGMELPIGRGRFADIVEVSTEIRESNKTLSESFNDFKESEQRKARQKARLDALNQVRESTTITTTTSSQSESK